VKLTDGIVFQRFGRTYQLRIQSAEDLANAVDLDEAHWVATSAPIGSIRCDSTFLRVLDRDGDGRIRAADVKQAIRWLFDRLDSTAAVNERSKVLRLSAIDTSEEEGQRIHWSATKMLGRLGRSEDGEIQLDEIRQFKAQVEGMPVSDAGVVLPEAADEENVRQFIRDILATVGGTPHPGGKQGVGQEQLDKFVAEGRAYLEWHSQGHSAEGDNASAILPFGAETETAFAVLTDLRAKVDQYFAQCSAVALDGRLVAEMPPREGDLKETNFADPEAIEVFMRGAPLAPPHDAWILDFHGPINPYYADRLAELRKRVLRPVLGREADQLEQREWERVKDHFGAYEEWLRAKPGESVEPLGLGKLETYLDGEYVDGVSRLIAQSRETSLQLDNVRLAEKLVLFQAYLMDFASNFVSFPHLYDPKSRAMFEMGTLVMDGRRFNFAMKVENRAEHESVAKTSDTFILYVQVAGQKEGESYEVVLPVTSGGRGNLVVGKRGIFQDINGRESDARVMQIIENPISISEAIVAPFRRMAGLITGKIEQLTSAAQKKLDVTTQQAITQPAGAPEAAAAQAQVQQAATSRGLMAGGLLAGGGVAVAALGSALAYISKVVAEHNIWVILGGLGAAVLAVLMPSVVLAVIKLRRRDLSAILEGSGWAINARMRLSRTQTRYFTQHPPYPPGAKGFAILRRWVWWLVLVVILLGVGGFFVYQAKRGHPQKPAVPSSAPPAEQEQPPVGTEVKPE
jgi:hypothetical protein